MYRGEKKLKLDVPMHDQWSIFREAMSSIVQEKSSKYSIQSVHHSVTLLCGQSMGRNILEEIEALLTDASNHIANKLREEPSSSFPMLFLKSFTSFVTTISKMESILLYFNLHFLAPNYECSLQDIGEKIFMNNVIDDSYIGNKVQSVIPFLRNNKDQWDLLENINTIIRPYYEKCDKYKSCIEEPYLRCVRDLYTNEAFHSEQISDVNAYTDSLRSIITLECRLAERFISPLSKHSVDTLLCDVLVRQNKKFITSVEKECARLPDSMNEQTLANIISMFVRMEDAEQLIHILESVVRKRMQDMIGAGSRRAQFIKELLTLATRVSQISSFFPPLCGKVEDTLMKTISTELSQDKAFVEEVVCFYDRCMHKSANANDAQSLCETMIKLFHLVEDKAAFETTFRNFLAVRLLSESESRIEEEKRLVEALRTSHGQEYVYKMERMIADARNAAEFQDNLQSAMNRHVVQQLPIDLRIHIVTQAAWPTYTNVPLNLPQPMELCRKVVTQFYVKRHEERVLKFQLALGSVLFRLFHNNTVYSVSASTVFAPSILALNSNNCLGVQQLQTITGLNANEVIEQMETLCRTKLACKTEPGSCKLHTLCYRFNTDFHSPSTEIKVIGSTANSIDTESKVKHGKSKPQVHHSVDALRSNIMHVMKEKRCIHHNDLCKLVVESLERFFVPTRAEMKSQIEALIDKGFIYRDERDSSKYIYAP